MIYYKLKKTADPFSLRFRVAPRSPRGQRGKPPRLYRALPLRCMMA
jgi:hypothetical protein